MVRVPAPSPSCPSSLRPRSLRPAPGLRHSMSLIFDEFGRPFIILREQQQMARVKGLEAQKVGPLPRAGAAETRALTLFVACLRDLCGPRRTSSPAAPYPAS